MMIRLSLRSFRDPIRSALGWIFVVSALAVPAGSSWLVASAAIALPAPARADGAVDREALAREYRAFFEALGFEDLSERIERNLSAGRTGPGPLSREVQVANRERYRVLNDARELATELLLDLERRGDDRVAWDRLARLTGRMLAMRPYEPPRAEPAEISGIQSKSIHDGRLDQFLERAARENLAAQTRAVFGDVMGVLHTPAELSALAAAGAGEGVASPALRASLDRARRVGEWVNRLTAFQYADGQLGTTRYLGRALAAGMTRVAQLRARPELLRALEAELAALGVDYRNFVGDTAVFADADGRNKVIHFQNGDFVMERSIGNEAGGITFAARPGGAANGRLARQKGLEGYLIGVAAPEDSVAGRQSILSLARGAITELPIATRGVSHVGLAEVRRDPDTGIRMTWALDIYYNDHLGGVRIAGIPETFAKRSDYLRFLTARYDVDKLRAWAREWVAVHGYSRVAWIAEREAIGPDGSTLDDSHAKREPVELPTLITNDEFNELHSMPDSRNREWYELLMRRITDRFRYGFLADEGLAFATNFTNFAGRGYCSSAIVIAGLQTAGFDLQKTHDDWALTVKGLHAAGVESAKVVGQLPRIVAPAGFAWQADLVIPQSIRGVDFRSLSPAKRAELEFAPAPSPLDPAASAAADALVDAGILPAAPARPVIASEFLQHMRWVVQGKRRL